MSQKNVKKLSYHRRVMDLLADGEWHTLKDIHKAVARFIDAEVADKEYRKRHPRWEEEKLAVRVAQGKKRLIFLSLNSAVHHAKKVEARGQDWDREYRLTREALADRQGSKAVR